MPTSPRRSCLHPHPPRPAFCHWGSQPFLLFASARLSVLVCSQLCLSVCLSSGCLLISISHEAGSGGNRGPTLLFLAWPVTRHRPGRHQGLSWGRWQPQLQKPGRHSCARGEGDEAQGRAGWCGSCSGGWAPLLRAAGSARPPRAPGQGSGFVDPRAFRSPSEGAELWPTPQKRVPGRED